MLAATPSGRASGPAVAEHFPLLVLLALRPEEDNVGVDELGLIRFDGHPR